MKKLLHFTGWLILYAAILYAYAHSIGPITQYPGPLTDEESARQTGEFVGDALVSAVIFFAIFIPVTRRNKKA